MEPHILRSFWHLNDLGETRFALLHLRWRNAVSCVSTCCRVSLSRVSRAALRIIELHAVDFLPGAFLKYADSPVLDFARDIDPFDLWI
jgi:hypothetical protein